MKKVLITGKNSYIGISTEKWLIRETHNYEVDTIDLKDISWKEKDFSVYDVVFHVAGIAHIKESTDNQGLYYKVNRDLAYETALKAKKEGVKQFVFLSSMSVYGVDSGIIDSFTPTYPKTAYGKSKLEAEELINELSDDIFSVAIVRPPMVYGKDCKGNYPRLVSLALKSPIFPNIENKRSMIYIENLCEFVKNVIDDKGNGLYFPQNSEYVNTSQLVMLIAAAHSKKIRMTKLVNPLIRLFKISLLNKVFGDLVYDMSLSEYSFNYRVSEFNESIFKTEVEQGDLK